ncbi:MAG: hypothetical protein NC338_06825 [Firmicutes bacterium]|nr:hypothetical protein [Bacillota bacterium]MCM1402124.1 hypothetical protein [Bacteroides sp.]MCM1478025.1 hypothetical protein [Bacteroides sp.]
MYKITYLDRNGFLAVSDDVIMVFDFYSDPSHALHRALEAAPDCPVVFFVTSHQKEHLNKSIYELGQNHKRVYVMSNDVYPQNVPSTIEVAGMSKGDIIEDLPGGLTVKAYGTASKGVAFLVTDKNGKKIFHAGAMDDPEPVEQLPERKTDSQCSVGVAVNRVASENAELDIAFFPTSTDMESHVAKHTMQFLNEIKVKDFFPIHIGSDNVRAADYAGYAVNGATVHLLREPGQSITL